MSRTNFYHYNIKKKLPSVNMISHFSVKLLDAIYKCYLTIHLFIFFLLISHQPFISSVKTAFWTMLTGCISLLTGLTGSETISLHIHTLAIVLSLEIALWKDLSFIYFQVQVYAVHDQMN